MIYSSNDYLFLFTLQTPPDEAPWLLDGCIDSPSPGCCHVLNVDGANMVCHEADVSWSAHCDNDTNLNKRGGS